MNINDAGRALIKRFESLRLYPYRDPKGIWTIGYGHTGDVNERTKPITAHQAEAILDVDINVAETIVSVAVKVPLTSNQFSAIVSFVFNVGHGKKDLKDGFVELMNGSPSTMLRRLNAGIISALHCSSQSGITRVESSWLGSPIGASLSAPCF